MRSPRLNFFGVEEESDPAEGFTGVDLHGAAPGDGGELGTTAAMEEHGRERKERKGWGMDPGQVGLGTWVTTLSTAARERRGHGGMGAPAWRQWPWSPL